MFVTTFRKLGLAASSLMMCMTPQPVMANDQVTVRSVTVSYRDLDLMTDYGLRIANDRIDRAVESVCRPRGWQSFDEFIAFQRCRRTATTHAKAAIQLAVARARNGQQVDNAIDNLAMPVRGG